jgi:hypothetical protein
MVQQLQQPYVIHQVYLLIRMRICTSQNPSGATSVDGYRIRKIVLSTAIISTLAGTGTAGFVDNVAATSGQLNWPFDVWMNSVGTLFVVDTNNYRIRTISNGIISTYAGYDATFNGDNIEAKYAKL